MSDDLPVSQASSCRRPLCLETDLCHNDEDEQWKWEQNNSQLKAWYCVRRERSVCVCVRESKVVRATCKYFMWIRAHIRVSIWKCARVGELVWVCVQSLENVIHIKKEMWFLVHFFLEKKTLRTRHPACDQVSSISSTFFFTILEKKQ